ncbi:HIR complex subunit [Vanrija albida]|uniref:Protein HIR n=1 Tax=Vanrija albida TaxID=181172 RepID=A0ABR3QCL1_9TREE
MKVVKPNWVIHSTDEKQSRTPIYSISVHPDGTRLATGGQDNKVKIWSTLPILDSEAAENELNHKLLCTMASHTGPVLAVRWAHHGRYLASGSDDSVVLIWDIDPAGGGRVFGSEEFNVENWKALRRLVGHVADVVDCAWSRDDSMLASVGLDSKIFIWDGYSFEKLRTIDAHQGFVKGVTWDPVGNYLATQSDDKTVRIWNTDDWKEVQVVRKPFEMSPQSTFFRRLSWSPDGAFIAASNAMNGPVFVAAVIEREGWASDISFVGHQNTIQVAAFNPRLFFRPGEDHSRVTASCMVALGADDYTISIWRNTLHKPLAVIRDIFGRQLLDLCWANDGLTLYGCSADGTICAIQFETKEFPELSGPEETSKILKEYEFKPKHHRPVRVLQSPADFTSAPTNAVEHVNVLKPRKGKPAARRINLSGTMTGGAGANGSAAQPSGSLGRAPLQRPTLQPPSPQVSRRGAADAFSFANDQPFSSRAGGDATARMFDDVDAFRAGEKRRTYEDDFRAVKHRSLGSARTVGPVSEIRAPRVILSGGSGGGGGHLLPLPSIQTVVRVQQDEGGGVITAENDASDSSRSSVSFSANGKDIIWIDYVPSPILAVVATSAFCAAAAEDGTVRVYSVSGRHLASLKLPAPVSELAGSKDMLLVATVDCNVRVIDTRHGKTVLQPSSISHLLNPPSSSSNPAATSTVNSVLVRPNGCPVVVTSEPAAWAYDAEFGGWTQIAAPWWSSSPLNETRTRHGKPTLNGPLSEIEQTVVAGAQVEPPDPKPEHWDLALSTGHYETRLRAARLLDSKDEYKHWLREYSKFLGQESFREQAEELITELMGPVYNIPAKPQWEPNLFGTPKRDLAKDALHVMKAYPSLQQWAQEQIHVLKRIGQEETRWT